MDLPVPADLWLNLKENEKKDKYLDFARELKKLLKMKVTIIPIVIGSFGKITEWLKNKIGGLGNKRTSGDHPNYYIIENG